MMRHSNHLAQLNEDSKSKLYTHIQGVKGLEPQSQEHHTQPLTLQEIEGIPRVLVPTTQRKVGYVQITYRTLWVQRL
jgi:hypothetical protein